ncbi:hypothetical protein QE152_g32603 [Popillia japonica]|uniref:Uncharacterized protein n=1 Tax=Popillia japonica TaxID=7064 RepID=A0AAW1IYJ4_POPJA
MYNYAAMYGHQYPYGMTPQAYAQYAAQYYQYPMMNYAQYTQAFKPLDSVDKKDDDKKDQKASIFHSSETVWKYKI